MSTEIKDSKEWKDFEEWLTEARRRSRLNPNDRDWAIRSLLAVALFIERVNPAKKTTLARLFGDLGCALIEMESGIVPPILRPKVMRHRPPDSFERRTIKEIAAVAMTILVERGFARQEAAKAVAGCLRDCAVKVDGRRQLGWTTVASWRDQMKSPTMAKAYSGRLARERREFAKELGKETSRAEVRRLLLERLLLSLLNESEEIGHAIRSNKAPAARIQFIKIARDQLMPRAASGQAPPDSK